MNEEGAVQPRRPTHLSTYADACLQALSVRGLGDCISVGGALGLLHYLDYRPTHDVDAWWMPATSTQEQEKVVEAIETTLQPFGQVRRRSWGDVISIELEVNAELVFSFQIARRDAQLEPSGLASWTSVLLDSFPDLVASKMVALIERGAPRDFRDIYSVCLAGLTTPAQCWQWWRERQKLAHSDADFERARLAVDTHLSRIEQHRPLAQIADTSQRAGAEAVRNWFRQEFLDALVD
jgi:hypothetical protein